MEAALLELLELAKVARSTAEIDISVSQLLSFETFANFWSFLVSEDLISEKSLRFGFGKNWSRKKSRFRKIWPRRKSIGFDFRKIWYRKKVSVSVSENLVS